MRADIEHPVTDNELSYIQDCLGIRFLAGRSLPLPPADLDWDRLLTLLKRHRLSAFFYSLRFSLGSGWPVEFRRQLRLDRDMLLLYGDQCAGRVAKILTGLREAGLDVVVLKGWAFIQTIYAGDHSLRFCEDIDLLVRPLDATRAAGVLRELGYRSVPECWPGYHERYLNAQAYVFTDQPQIFNRIFSAGLHWGLFHTPYYNPDQVDMQALFERARPLDVEGVGVLELSIEDQVVYGCAHWGLHHGYDEALSHYYELAALIQRAGKFLDWAAIIQRAREWRCIIPLQRILDHLEFLWPGQVPPAVLEQIHSLSPVFLERFVNWWVGKTGDRPSFEHLLIWITTPGLKRRFAMAFQLTFPSPGYLQERYGPAPWYVWPVYYFRWFFQFIRWMGKASSPGS